MPRLDGQSESFLIGFPTVCAYLTRTQERVGYSKCSSTHTCSFDRWAAPQRSQCLSFRFDPSTSPVDSLANSASDGRVIEDGKGVRLNLLCHSPITGLIEYYNDP